MFVFIIGSASIHHDSEECTIIEEANRLLFYNAKANPIVRIFSIGRLGCDYKLMANSLFMNHLNDISKHFYVLGYKEINNICSEYPLAKNI